MDLITDEFVFARTGEPLEARLKDSDSFRQQMKSLHGAAKKFTRDSVKSDECWKTFGRLEEEWSKYNIRYGEESYRLGFEDGVQLASEREIRLRVEDEMYERLADILDDAEKAPEERAKLLAGQDKE